jgi:hypothetical protein
LPVEYLLDLHRLLDRRCDETTTTTSCGCPRLSRPPMMLQQQLGCCCSLAELQKLFLLLYSRFAA